ncbi:hypothetical protein HPP92_022034 [Vanilla planifolia]|uniref:Peptidase M16 C-terminal domain-containing protein n=1 Tax=Vanilla planifolia TaxID=51239 RepID=A0A835UHE4_VANPL|nr:hypothetical protein HPP92_022034 [Vanilla planifolia]
MAASSLVAAAPQLCSPSQRVDRRCFSFSPANLVIPRAINGSRAAQLSIHRRRMVNFDPKEKTKGKPRLARSWKPQIHGGCEDVTSAASRQLCCLACLRSSHKHVDHIKVHTQGVFICKPFFSLQKHTISGNVKPVHIPYASLGPDEPHVASKTWSEAIIEKQGLGFWDPEVEKAELGSFLSSPLPSHPKLYRGQLKNGLRYLILPNKFPANRIEAHMEVHVGSIDEEDDEQGIAHMIEHDSDGDLLPFVLDALNEIAFYPKFLPSRVEKERKAILSELQMMNTIEYRVDCQLLQHLHSENKLSKRFPIGLEEQIKMWDAEKIRKFHERWYFPANATLYLVGDIDNIPGVVCQIEAVFGRTLEKKDAPLGHATSAFGAMANFLVPKLPSGITGSLSLERSASLDQEKPAEMERHATRPSIQHIWSLPGYGQNAKPPQIFQHELIQNFSINLFCKLPVNSVQTYGGLRNVLMKRIIVAVLHFRINSRYKSSSPPFTSFELDHSDSGREGCTVTTLTVTAEPKNWQNAIKVAVQEVRRLKEFGVTKGELSRYMGALIKDSEQLAAMIDSIPSVDILDFIMESDALSHTVMDHIQGHECLVAVAETVTLEEVNSICAEVLEFIADFGKPTAPLPAAVVACVPKKVHTDGFEEADFVIHPQEITNAIRAGLQEPIHAEPELAVPKELITSSQLQELRSLHRPAFVSLTDESEIIKRVDSETGIIQLRLSNGIPINYKISKNEARGGVMRLIVGGGRAAETSASKGSVIVGVRTLSEGGCVGNFSREQVELFCMNHLINCSLESNEEIICMEFRFTLRDNGMRAAFQLLHMVLEHNVWLEDAFERAKQVSIVGDFTEEEIESCILDYLGTVRANKGLDIRHNIEPIIFRPSPSDYHVQQIFLKDTDERACAYIAGPAPNRWGFSDDGKDLFSLMTNTSGKEVSSNTNDGKDFGSNIQRSIRYHPLFFGVTLGLLAEIINSRLFTTVRDSLGLTYDVSFEVSLFDKLKLGWYVITVTSTPSKVYKAVDACKDVLRGLHSNKIAQRELDRAKRTLLMRHEAETKSNAYWLGLLAHLQASFVPRKDICCIKDLASIYEAATIEDIYMAYQYLKVDDASLFSCIGVAGTQSNEELSGKREECLKRNK